VGAEYADFTNLCGSACSAFRLTSSATFLTALGLVIGNRVGDFWVVTISSPAAITFSIKFAASAPNLIYGSTRGTNTSTKVEPDFYPAGRVEAVRKQLGPRLIAALE